MSCCIVYYMETKLQIISGKYRKRNLAIPPEARPTQNRARIALFNMLLMVQGETRPLRKPFTVWDAFAGSGAFGLEYISRYPKSSVIFTDAAESSIAVIRKNLMPGEESRTIINRTDAIGAIPTYGTLADVVFVDPPYAAAAMGAGFVQKLAQYARPGTLLVWEQDIVNAMTPDDNWGWEILRDVRYGRARFLIMRMRDE